MNNHSLSFFSRLYINIIFTVIFSVLLAYVVIDFLIEEDDIKQFARDAELVLSSVDRDFEHLVYLDDKHQLLSLPYPLSFDFTAKVVTKTNPLNQCQNCVFVTEIDELQIYEFEDGERFVSMPLQDRDKNLVFYEKLDEERTPEQLAHSDPEQGPYILFSLVSTLIVFLGMTIYWPVKRLQTQVRSLIRSQKTFGSGDLTARANEKIQRPMDELALSFNEMADAISNNVKERDIFAQAIPHEVRTPLSRIQLASGLIRKKNNDFDTLALLDDVDSYVSDISHLISQIVEFSRLNEHKHTKQGDVQSINVSDFIQSRVKLLSRLTEKTISCDLPDNLILSANSVYLRLLIDNFVKNAINYAEEKVEISAVQHASSVVITVNDDGCGIPKEQIETVFIPFARLDQSRNRATGGLGLGLSIAKAASDKMDGEIRVGKSSLGGAKFQFIAPIQR